MRGGDRGSSGRSWGGDRGGSSERGRSWGGDRGRTGSRPDFNPEDIGKRISGFMDTNRDGYIDAGELQRLPPQARERMAQSGVDLRRGISAKDLTARTTTAIRERMEQRERERSGDDRSKDRRDYDRRDSGGKTSSGKTIFKQSERQKILRELPPDYVEGDADEDGQIALFEWAAWKRNDMFAFFDLDKNKDGFLTSRELLMGESDADRGITMKRERLAVAGVNGGSRVRSASSPNAKSTRPGTGGRTTEQLQRDTGRAKYYFSALDRDRDGKISAEEWNRSRTIKGMFEKAGIKSSTFDQATFTKNYLKASQGSASSGRSWGGSRGDSSGGSDRGRSWGGDRGTSDRGSSDRGRGGDRGSSDRGRDRGRGR